MPNLSHISEMSHKDLSPALRRKCRMRGTQRWFDLYGGFLLDFVWIRSSSNMR
jgi:hypothetical protein